MEFIIEMLLRHIKRNYNLVCMDFTNLYTQVVICKSHKHHYHITTNYDSMISL